MRYATAIGHLRLVAEACAEDAARSVISGRPQPYGLAVYTFGDILDGHDDPEGTDVVFVVDEGADTLPWGRERAALRGFISLARIDRHPIRWVALPRDLQVGCHPGIVRPVRLWDTGGGIDEVTFEALRERRGEDVRLPAVDDETSQDACDRHLAVTRAALDDAIERFWDGDWRREHKGGGRHPEHDLWELAWGVRNLERG